MTVEVKVTPSHQLTVGSKETNSISFEITATEEAKLFASIEIPCGEATADTAYLSGVDKPDLIFGSAPFEIKGKRATKDNELSWVSNAFRLGAEKKIVTITITGFNPESAGRAPLRLKIWDDPTVKPYPYDAETKVTIAPAQKAAILSFDASPRNVLQGGQVKASSKTTQAKTVQLFAGDTEVKGGTVVKEGDPLEKQWLDYPQTNPATYRLKLDGEFIGGEVTVKVETRGGELKSQDLLKNSLEPPKQSQHFYPTLLLAAKDLSASAGKPAELDRLYGIFTFVDLAQRTKRAELWSSASGVDGWQEASGLRIQGGAELRGADVPEGMDESPGVIHNNTLWLFGGSSANPAGPFSNRLWGYYKSTDKKEMVWDEWKVEREKEELFTPRMGHACAVLNERLWVLGGLSPDGGLLDDVWSCAIPKYAGGFQPDWKKCPTPLPSGGRCMSAVAVTPEHGSESARLWLYGGATHPDNFKETFDELWWTNDAEVWHHLTLPPKPTREEGRATLGATLLYAKGLLHLVRIFQSGATPSNDFLRDMTQDPPNWKPEACNFHWETPQFGLFLMRSVVFRERWIFWPVYQYMDMLTYPQGYLDKAANYDTMIFNATK